MTLLRRRDVSFEYVRVLLMVMMIPALLVLHAHATERAGRGDRVVVLVSQDSILQDGRTFWLKIKYRF